MAELKTKQTGASVAACLDAISDQQKRADYRAVGKMMAAATGSRAKMWGSSIVGYGTYDYKYATGHEGSAPLCGYSSRAQNITIYIMPGFSPFKELMDRLGKYRIGKSCLYIRKLEDVDQKVLNKLIDESVVLMRKRYQS